MPEHQGLKHITSIAVEDALSDFLVLDPGSTWERLASDIRLALSITMVASESASNVIRRNQLRSYAKLADKTFSHIASRPAAVDHLLEAQEHYGRFIDALAELAWLGTYLKWVADGLPTERPNHRLKGHYQLRQFRAAQLRPVFRAAFGLPATVNNAASPNVEDDGTPWMRFYVRIMDLAFEEKAIPNLSMLLKDA